MMRSEVNYSQIAPVLAFLLVFTLYDNSYAEKGIPENILEKNSVAVAPLAGDDNYTVYEGTTLAVSAPGVLGNDSDATDVYLLTGPASGTLQLNADGSFTYNHNGTSTLDDSFTYVATNGTETDTATVVLDVLPVSFGVSSLSGHTLNKPTSLSFGPDSLLYVLRKLGHVNIMEVQRDSANSYSVVDEEVIILPRQIPNHDDDGTYNPGENNRQATGIVVAGTISNPIMYVSSSDARVGGNGGATDTNLDTNSGVISQITWIGATRDDPSGYWERVDIVRGLPRSEENHANNGLAMSVTGDTLFVAMGGFTNAGAPSNNFAFITEYALSAAILAVDLTAINAMPVLVDSLGVAYKYDLPTLDDPTRSNVNGITDPGHPDYDGIDFNDPWGGNDGLNQAKFIPGSPVVVYASGFRNPYDVTITASGRMYAVDNGANGGWGGHPVLEGPSGVCTNDYDPLEPGSSNPGPNDPPVNNLDNLHYVRELTPGQKYYAGHPTPVRGNPAGAGLYTGDHGSTGVFRDGSDVNNPLPADWPPVPVSEAYPVECDFRNPGETDGALSTFAVSTNGLTEYTASNFGGAYTGDLFAAGYNNNTLYHIDLNATGDQVLNNHPNGNGTGIFAENFGSIPLDVIALGDNDLFPGTIWVADLDNYNVYVFEPADYDGNVVAECTGVSDPFLDEDSDGYDNEDEILNNTNPCSSASKPADADGDLTSNLVDTDDDNDSVLDLYDAFQIDANNGTTTGLPLDYPLLNEDPGTGFFGLGLTGLMTNDTDDYLDLYDFNELIPGGTAGLFTVTNVPEGQALGSANSQLNGFQVGVDVGQSTGNYTARVRILGPFFNALTPQNDQAQGFYIGTGDQENYIAVLLHAQDGAGGIRIIHEEGGIVQSSVDYEATGILNAVNLDLYLSVDPVAGSVQPKYKFDGGPTVFVGLPMTVSSDLLSVIQGTYQVQPGINSRMAVGLMATSEGAGPAFNATWDHIEVTADPISTVDEWITLQAPTNPKQRHENAFVEAGGKFYLLGGRGSRRSYEYDPVANTWTQLSFPPVEFHHFQAVALGDTVYVIGAYLGDFPSETPVSNIYKYIPSSDTWVVGSSLPAGRERGSTGLVPYNGKLYMVAGSIGGHASTATYPTMFDEYDPATNTWTVMPDAPRGRDHFNAAVVGSKMYVLGGRAGAVGATVSEVDVYDFVAGTWSTLPSGTGDVPTPRGGTTAAVIGNDIFFLGGESGAQTLAHSEVEVLDVSTNTWRSLDDLDTGRHGTQAAVSGNHIYIAAGSGETGGGPELSSLEIFERTSLSDPGAVLPSTLVASPATHDFGQIEVGFGGTQPVSLTNTAGNQNIELSSIALTGSSDFAVSYGVSLPHVLLPGESLELTVDYNPSAAGPVAASIDVTHDGANGPVSIALDGEGTEGVLSDDPIYRVNAGGSAVLEEPLDWDRDTKNKPSAYVNTGTGDNNINKEGVFTGVNNTGAPSELFETNRWDPDGSEEMEWNFPVASASVYDIRLYFKEGDASNHEIGGRIFDVAIEGTVVLDDYDVFADVGANVATVKSFQIYVDDGNIDVDFLHVVDHPMIHGIQISPVTAGIDLVASADSLDFYTIEVDSTSEAQSISLTNTSSGSLDITAVSVSGEHSGDFSHTFAAPQTMTGGQEVTFDLSFTPSGVGDRNAQLDIVHSGENSPLSIPLTGNGSEVHLSFLEILVTGSGSVSKTPDQPLYSDGEVVTLEAIADPGWEFDAWTGSVSSVDNPVSITIAGDMTVTATFLESSTTIDPLYRVNAGGGSESDAPIVWDRDTKNKPSDYVNANIGDNNVGRDAFTGVNTTNAPSVVYDRNRWDPDGSLEMEWDFPVSAVGSYDVNLYFAETSPKDQAIGDRIFDVVIEGNLVLDDYDIVADAGWQTAVSKSFSIEVTDGNIDIDFLHVNGDPLISAIEILPSPATMPISMKAGKGSQQSIMNGERIRQYELVGSEDWALIGHPLMLGNQVSELFEGDVDILGYNGSDFKKIEEYEQGQGIWMRSGSEQTFQYLGTEIEALDVPVREGWNLISGPSCDVKLDRMRGYEHLVPNTLYRYDGGYYQSQRLEQGRGYWVYARKAGTLTLDCATPLPISSALISAEPESFGELSIVDGEGASRKIRFAASPVSEIDPATYLLPPKAPGNGFDARLSEDNWAMEGTSGIVSIQGGVEPYILELSMLPERLGQEYVVSVLRNKTEIEVLKLKAGDLVELPEDIDEILLQSVDEWQAELPETFSLKGNYPNPFNPQTSIIFDLPEQADIEIEVFDVIGRRVMTLSQEAMEAGRARVVQFDGRGLASGVYLYHIKAHMSGGVARESGKMTLVK